MTHEEDRQTAPSREEIKGVEKEAEKKSESIRPAPGAPMQRGENR